MTEEDESLLSGGIDVSFNQRTRRRKGKADRERDSGCRHENATRSAPGIRDGEPLIEGKARLRGKFDDCGTTGRYTFEPANRPA